MCADVEAFTGAVEKRGIRCSPVQDLGWGRLTQLTLPGGGKLGVYQPRHARPRAMSLVRGGRKPAAAKPKAIRKPAPAKKKTTRR
jgi:hypothetical protein